MNTWKTTKTENIRNNYKGTWKCIKIKRWKEANWNIWKRNTALDRWCCSGCTDRQMVTGQRSPDILMVLLAPSITKAKRKKIHPACLTFKLHPLSLNEGGGGLEGNKVEKKNTILQRTYNVLEPTSTNTTSTSAWSLRNSWMQYITLTLPCLDSGRWGPEREEHTGWAVAEVKVSKPRCRVQKKRVTARTALLSAFQIVRTSWLRLKSWEIQEDTSSSLKRSSHTSKIKTISYGFFKQCAYLSKKVCKPEVSHPNCLKLAWIHWDIGQINHTECTAHRVKVWDKSQKANLRSLGHTLSSTTWIQIRSSKTDMNRPTELWNGPVGFPIWFEARWANQN